jgi:hypothetical protein
MSIEYGVVITTKGKETQLGFLAANLTLSRFGTLLKI